MSYDRLFAAFGDPTRRRILETLRARPMSVGELAERQPVSRPAVSQHLRVLESARLVRVERRGARRIYSVDQTGLDELWAYLQDFWWDSSTGQEANG